MHLQHQKDIQQELSMRASDLCEENEIEQKQSVYQSIYIYISILLYIKMICTKARRCTCWCDQVVKPWKPISYKSYKNKCLCNYCVNIIYHICVCGLCGCLVLFLSLFGILHSDATALLLKTYPFYVLSVLYVDLCLDSFWRGHLKLWCFCLFLHYTKLMFSCVLWCYFMSCCVMLCCLFVVFWWWCFATNMAMQLYIT